MVSSSPPGVFPNHPWNISTTSLALLSLLLHHLHASFSFGAAFIPSRTSSCYDNVAAFKFKLLREDAASKAMKLFMVNNQQYSAEWIDLLSPNSYYSTVSSAQESVSAPPASPTPSVSLTGKIYPPRSGGVSFTTPDHSKVFSFAGYAEDNIISTSTTVDRYVVNDLWEFVPYQHEKELSNRNQWGWSKVLQNEQDDYIPGPRLATALAILPPFTSEDTKTIKPVERTDDNTPPPRAILLGGWDPQIPGTGGAILDDISVLDMNTMKWSPCVTRCSKEEEEFATVPGGPTSRHVAVSLSIPFEKQEGGGEKRRNVICLHNHICEDHVLLLSTDDKIGKSSSPGKETRTIVEWKSQLTSGEAPSSRGLHCAATIHNSQTMVIFGGAAKDGSMSNESFILDTTTWKWTKLYCGGTKQNLPSPRAGACLCTLDNDTVLLFGGATPISGGLVGLNDVWILTVDSERGIGRWECLIENADDGYDDGNDGRTLCPPGRNAATLCPIAAEKLLPRNVVREINGSKSSLRTDYGEDSSYFLLSVSYF